MNYKNDPFDFLDVLYCVCSFLYVAIVICLMSFVFSSYN